MMHIPSGLVNMVIDGQFGSTGKGLLANCIGVHNHIDIAIADLSPNAGHTFYMEKNKYTVRMLPVVGVLQDRSTIYYPPSAVIDPEILFREIKEYDIDPSRIVIHPRAAVISDEDRELESHLFKISSTLSGTGGARARKILRVNPLATGTPSLKHMVNDKFDLTYLLEYCKCTCLVETGQGIDLGIDYGYQYPNCTSRDVTPSHILANLGIHPTLLGSVACVFRAYPIRVGNRMDNDRMIGYSGDVWPDSKEISFQTLDILQELSSVTKKPRRIFTFSHEQYQRTIDICRPDIVLLNFCNYIQTYDELEHIYRFDKKYQPTHVSYGPTVDHVLAYDRDI